MSGRMEAGAWQAAGPRAVERQLLAELLRLAEEGLAQPERMALPVRVVVPSRSLAQHVSAALVGGAGRALLGFSIRTLHALALEVLTRAGEAPAGGEALFPVLVRSLAREEPGLREPLEGLHDGYAAVEANVRDLLDAGFESPHAEPLLEGIADAASGDLALRAAAVVRVASRTVQALEKGPVSHASMILRRAADALAADPERLPGRAILLHGFADATGVQLDLLEVLVRRCGARLLVDRPPDPADPSLEESGAIFTRRVVERLAPGGLAPDDSPPLPAPGVEVLHAPGPEAELRAVAERVGARIAAGAAPEALAIVARDLAGYRAALRRHLLRLGIPFSGLGQAGPPRPEGRRVRSLLALLADPERFPAERWIDLARLDASRSGVRRADLRVGLHALGAARLARVARLGAVGSERLRLPVRTGLKRGETDGSPLAPRRRLAREALDEAVARAGSLLERLARWPHRAAFGRHLAELRGLVRDELRWRRDSPEYAAVAALWRSPDAPDPLEVERGDFGLWLERELRDAGCDPLGGAGAGVQVLGVMEARARTFDSLFVIGMNRDLFPRTITEDPLLPDTLRQRLRGVLPDLPVKREGNDEERFLFAQLLAAAPRVVLSCSVTDDDGKRRQPSPLVERLRLAGHVPEPVILPALHGRQRAGSAAPLTAAESCTLAALHGTRARFDGLLPAALTEAWEGDAGRAGLAMPRIAVLREIDSVARGGDDLGPYFGFIGPAGEVDLRRNDFYVTTAEGAAGCPWRTFLSRLLRLEALPDPLASLPAAVDARLLGSVVHAVLETIAGGGEPGEPERLEEALSREARRRAWPEPREVEALVSESARALVAHEGIGLPGYDRVVADQASAILAFAREFEWGAGPPVVGVEVEGRVSVPDVDGVEREILFRADRVDLADGALRLVDYKTGGPKLKQVKADARRAALLECVSRGDLLQAAAYARAGRVLGFRARGEYLYLRPDADPRVLRVAVEGDDEELDEAFASVLAATFDLWDRGSFFPRLVQADSLEEPRPCSWCAVREACWRGDSGARARLSDWAGGRAAGAVDSLPPAERAFLGLWGAGA